MKFNVKDKMIIKKHVFIPKFDYLAEFLLNQSQNIELCCGNVNNDITSEPLSVNKIIFTMSPEVIDTFKKEYQDNYHILFDAVNTFHSNGLIELLCSLENGHSYLFTLYLRNMVYCLDFKDDNTVTISGFILYESKTIDTVASKVFSN